MMNKSDLETSFEVWLAQHPDIPPAAREWRFHPTRQWRLDFAWPDKRVAVEVEGVTSFGKGIGRHQGPKGFEADAEKYNAALIEGWKVYRVPGPWIAIGRRTIWKPQVMSDLRILLGIA